MAYETVHETDRGIRIYYDEGGELWLRFDNKEGSHVQMSFYGASIVCSPDLQRIIEKGIKDDSAMAQE